MTLLVDDRGLLAGFRDGRPEALGHVYRHYAPRVAQYLRNGFVYSSGGQSTLFPGIRAPFDLESTVQEVFARAFAPRARMAYDGLRPYEGFLIGIARNVVLDGLRKQARRGEAIEPLEVLERRVASGGGAGTTVAPPAPEESMDERRGRELVNAFLTEACNERDRRLYELRYGKEMSQEAAAQEAGLTRIQVRRWETKFRARLLRYLKRARYVR